MRTISHNIYKFNELCPEAQEKAIEAMTQCIGSLRAESDSCEYRETLKKIEEVFDIKVEKWNVGYPGTFCRWEFTTNRWDDVARSGPKYLLRYVNAVKPHIESGRYYSTLCRFTDGKYRFKKRCSKVLHSNYYTLTGTWCDAAVDEALRTACDQARRGCCLEDFISDMLSNFFHCWEGDIDSAYSEEYVREELEANEYEFYADGRLFS